ncbi:MauE/DoxX family redox-associated membrane protein [Pedobacter sp. UBA4863]|uniref:MauE/DoxX family redox-associated membrane protein n=1 Tax=Pedobacter sp. UBA4863 TaxID=1947060 RepID=UPI0025FA499A|nr:MauE/DoxX family redox-associated membrane protein [Pedobacter sp. UBA4863]
MVRSPIHRNEALVLFLTIASILFWLYVAGVSVYNFGLFKSEMANQVFPKVISNLLAYFLPTLEILTAFLLAFSTTRLLGMALSLLMISAFTLYVGLALLRIYENVPCTCAGLLKHGNSWGTNFLLNLLITAVALIGFILTYKQRKEVDKRYGFHIQN